jgi:hypothetical protein
LKGAGTPLWASQPAVHALLREALPVTRRISSFRQGFGRAWDDVLAQTTCLPFGAIQGRRAVRMWDGAPLGTDDFSWASRSKPKVHGSPSERLAHICFEYSSGDLSTSTQTANIWLAANTARHTARQSNRARRNTCWLRLQSCFGRYPHFSTELHTSQTLY